MVSVNVYVNVFVILVFGVGLVAAFLIGEKCEIEEEKGDEETMKSCFKTEMKTEYGEDAVNKATENQKLNATFCLFKSKGVLSDYGTTVNIVKFLMIANDILKAEDEVKENLKSGVEECYLQESDIERFLSCNKLHIAQTCKM